MSKTGPQASHAAQLKAGCFSLSFFPLTFYRRGYKMRQIKNRETAMRLLAAEIAAKSQQLAAISHHKITHAEASFAGMTESVATLLIDGGHVKTVIKVTPHIINNIADYKTSIIDSYIVNLDGFGDVVLHEILFYGEILLISEELF